MRRPHERAREAEGVPDTRSMTAGTAAVCRIYAMAVDVKGCPKMPAT
jgi:hypothetical protein